MNLPLQLNFIAFAVPGAVAALAMALFILSSHRHQAVSSVLITAKS